MKQELERPLLGSNARARVDAFVRWSRRVVAGCQTGVFDIRIEGLIPDRGV